MARKKSTTPKKQETKKTPMEEALASLKDVLESKEGVSLVEKIKAMPDRLELAPTIKVGDTELYVYTGINRLTVLTMVQYMLNIMEGAKDELGYKAFIKMIDDYEFMFYASFFTNLGLNGNVQDYMTIREKFEDEGVLEKFYELIEKQRKEIQPIFQRTYDLWKDETILTMSFVAGLQTNVEKAATKLMGLVGDDDSANDELIQMFLSAMVKESTGVTEKPSPSISVDMAAFQKRDISENIIELSKTKE